MHLRHQTSATPFGTRVVYLDAHDTPIYATYVVEPAICAPSIKSNKRHLRHAVLFLVCVDIALVFSQVVGVVPELDAEARVGSRVDRLSTCGPTTAFAAVPFSQLRTKGKAEYDLPRTGRL